MSGLSFYCPAELRSYLREEIGVRKEIEIICEYKKLPKSTKKDGSLDGIYGDETKQALLKYKAENTNNMKNLNFRTFAGGGPTDPRYLSGGGYTGTIEGYDYLNSNQQSQLMDQQKADNTWQGARQTAAGSNEIAGLIHAGAETVDSLGYAVDGQEGQTRMEGFTDPFGSTMAMYKNPEYDNLSGMEKFAGTFLGASGAMNAKMNESLAGQADVNSRIEANRFENNIAAGGGFMNSYAGGGMSDLYQGNVAEGGETAEMANGQLAEIQGPRHEQGGVPIGEDVKYVYSDRVNIKGTNITYADKSLKIDEKYAKARKMRPSDKSIDAAEKQEKERLQLLQESDPEILKLREETQPQIAAGGGPTDPPLQKRDSVPADQQRRYDTLIKSLNQQEAALDDMVNGISFTRMMSYLGHQDSSKDMQKYNNDLNRIPATRDSLNNAFNNGTIMEQGFKKYDVQKQYSGGGATYQMDPNKFGFNDWMGTNYAGGGRTGKLLSYLSNYEQGSGNALPMQFRDSRYPNNYQISTTGGGNTANPSYTQAIDAYKNQPMDTSESDALVGDDPLFKSGSVPDSALQNWDLDPTEVSRAGAMFNSIGPMSQFMDSLKGPDKTKYDRTNPKYVDSLATRTLLERAKALQDAKLKKGIAMSARTPGGLLTGTVAGQTASNTNFNNAIAGVNERTHNTNTGIYNQADARNAQIQMAEQNANDQNIAANRTMKHGALGDLGNIQAGYLRDTEMAKSQDIQNQRLMNTLNSMGYRYGIDQHGNITVMPNTYQG